MFSKAALSLAVLAVARLALAQPYCLLTAVNKFEHPADQETLCCKEASKVKSYLEELCPSAQQEDAVDAFETACKEAGYGDCKKESSSSESHSKTSSKKSDSTSAPYPIVSTTTYYDTECSCTKTSSHVSSGTAGSTGFVTASNPIATGTLAPSGTAPGSGAGSGSGPAATGSPISPASPGGTGSGSSPGGASFTGAATKNVGSVAAGLLAVAGIALAL